MLSLGLGCRVRDAVKISMSWFRAPMTLVWHVVVLHAHVSRAAVTVVLVRYSDNWKHPHHLWLHLDCNCGGCAYSKHESFPFESFNTRWSCITVVCREALITEVESSYTIYTSPSSSTGAMLG